eukprot:scaffold29690_cov24-Tisochrysis_lutea.AAC.3
MQTFVCHDISVGLITARAANLSAGEPSHASFTASELAHQNLVRHPQQCLPAVPSNPAHTHTRTHTHSTHLQRLPGLLRCIQPSLQPHQLRITVACGSGQRLLRLVACKFEQRIPVSGNPFQVCSCACWALVTALVDSPSSLIHCAGDQVVSNYIPSVSEQGRPYCQLSLVTHSLHRGDHIDNYPWLLILCTGETKFSIIHGHSFPAQGIKLSTIHGPSFSVLVTKPTRVLLAQQPVLRSY